MDYPFNCYEQEEIDDTSFTANDEDYAVDYVIVRLSRGMMSNSSEYVIYDSESDINGTEEEDIECIRDEDSSFYRTFPAITDQCIYSNEYGYPLWTKVNCNDDLFVLQRFNDSNECSKENGTVGFPTLYKKNGCEERLWRYAHCPWITMLEAGLFSTVSCVQSEGIIGSRKWWNVPTRIILLTPAIVRNLELKYAVFWGCWFGCCGARRLYSVVRIVSSV